MTLFTMPKYQQKAIHSLLISLEKKLNIILSINNEYFDKLIIFEAIIYSQNKLINK